MMTDTETETKNKGGRPLVVFTPDQIEQVERLSSLLSIGQMADYFSICENTFTAVRERQPEVFEAYKRGRAKAIGDVAGGLLQKAIEGDTTSAIFYLKTQAGWREKPEEDKPDDLAGAISKLADRLPL